MPRNKKVVYTTRDSKHVFLHNTISSKRAVARSLGGKWDVTTRCWLFPLDTDVESLCSKYADAEYDAGSLAKKTTNRRKQYQLATLQQARTARRRKQQHEEAKKQLGILRETKTVTRHSLKPEHMHETFVAFTGPKSEMDRIEQDGGYYFGYRSDDGCVFICVYDTSG